MMNFERIHRRAARAAITPVHTLPARAEDERAPARPPHDGGNLITRLTGPAACPVVQHKQTPASDADRARYTVAPVVQRKQTPASDADARDEPGVMQFAKGMWGKVQGGLKDIPALMDDASQEKTKTKQGTTWARRMDKTDRISDPTAYMSTPEIAVHLKEFKEGAHAFIKPEFHEKINKEGKEGGFGGWGRDANFVAPLSEANSLVEEAHKKAGLLTVEQRLGIPSGKDWSWAHPQKNPENKLFRYILRKPDAFGLRMATGRESGAYKEEWEAGGKTLGGGSEAVIDKLSLGDLNDAKSRGDLEVKEESFPETPTPGGGAQGGTALSAGATPPAPATPSIG
ncbi:MAG: hypothetical protein LC793_07875 [Thermomicrobia bacterium]|nr:hypothetical protein [Thermomicrobia bacterium]